MMVLKYERRIQRKERGDGGRNIKVNSEKENGNWKENKMENDNGLEIREQKMVDIENGGQIVRKERERKKKRERGVGRKN